MHIPGYRIIQKINQGGMSTVYLAVQLSVGREVALKVMSPALNADPVFSQRFQREANIVGQLSHPHIVSIYDIGQHNNLNYIAMDYLAGGSVHDKMKSGIGSPEALRITEQIANALEHAHDKGYIHRDIKPENILFREDDTAVLSDFGVAKTVRAASKSTNAGTVVGTPHYMSPEQARGQPIDGRSDLYSLGVVLYEMLTGSVPYNAEEAVAIAIKHLTAPIPKLPPQYAMFQPLLNKMLAKEANDRFQRGREVVEALAILQGNSRANAPAYLTETEPSALQILSLLKALIATSYAAVSSHCKTLTGWLAGWRWTPKRGFYHHPQVAVTEIKTTTDASEDERATIVSTRIQKAAHYQALQNRRLSAVFRSVSLLAMLMIIWVATSMGYAKLHAPDDNTDQNSGSFFSNALLATNQKISQLFADSEAAAPSENNSNNGTLADSNTSNLPKPAANALGTESGVSATANNGAAATESQTPLTALNIANTLEEQQPTTVEIPVTTPEPPHFALTVDAQPVNARVRILNIRERYYTGIPLLPGRYHVEVSAKGYDSIYEWVEITDQPLAKTFSLRKTPVPGATFSNELNNGELGPSMVIVPAGRFTMGHAGNSTTSPTREVRIAKPFAISQYEITFADYKKFAEATNRAIPSDNNWGQGSRPVVNVSWEDASAYAQWLNDNTGRKYRLPTEAEWEYAARAGSESDYWWSDQNPSGKANCRRGCNSDFTSLFNNKTAPVGSYKANAFGLFDTAGNVAEWVADCYQDHYIGAPSNGSAFQSNDCSVHAVRGGGSNSSSEELTSHSRDKLDSKSSSKYVGFRVAVDLY